MHSREQAAYDAAELRAGPSAQAFAILVREGKGALANAWLVAQERLALAHARHGWCLELREREPVDEAADAFWGDGMNRVQNPATEAAISAAKDAILEADARMKELTAEVLAVAERILDRAPGSRMVDMGAV